MSTVATTSASAFGPVGWAFGALAIITSIYGVYQTSKVNEKISENHNCQNLNNINSDGNSINAHYYHNGSSRSRNKN